MSWKRTSALWLVLAVAMLPASWGVVVAARAPTSRAPVPFAKGDVMAAVAAGKVLHLDSEGNLKETLDTTTSAQETGMCFDQSGNMLVTNFSANTVSKFDNAGNLLQATFVGPSGYDHPESCLQNSEGNFYIAQADVSSPSDPTLHKVSPSGTELATYKPGPSSTRQLDWIDLASDQC